MIGAKGQWENNFSQWLFIWIVKEGGCEKFRQETKFTGTQEDDQTE